MTEERMSSARRWALVGGLVFAAMLALSVASVTSGAATRREAVIEWLAVASATMAMAAVVLVGARAAYADWLIAVALAPITYLVLSAAQPAVVPLRYLLLPGPAGVSADMWSLVRLIVALGGVAVYIGLARGQAHRLQYGACVGLLAVSAAFFSLWEPPAPKPVPPVRPLAQLETKIRATVPGTWTGSHMKIDAATEKILGADEYLNLYLKSDAQPYQVTVFITYYANAMSKIPHVPWVCMTQAGFRVVDTREDAMTISAVAGKEIRPNVLYFERDSGARKERALMFHYFSVGGTYTGSRELARLLSTTGSLGREGSYLSQTQIVIALPPDDAEDPMDKKSPAYRLGSECLGALVPLLEKEYYPDLRNAEGG